MSRKAFSTRIDHDLQKEIKKLAIDLEEALRDILGKHGRTVAPAQPNSSNRKNKRVKS